MKFTFSLLLVTLTTLVSGAAIQKRTPPNIPTADTAKSMLANMATRTTDAPGYRRSLFPLWNTISGTCNTRETVLARDGTDVITNTACHPISGTWFSPYDGATWTQASDVDIDHVVPLSNAWKSGANTWTTARRQQFANDLVNPQLIAVTDNVNQEKGEKSPDQWKPPLASYYCTYARMWVAVKSFYALSVTAPEKSALGDMLNTC
ncbi:hypothetical protein BDD12DRAFT_849856 [Trichophaea hybrida]|nr:hypothetical protein BDD12DRAFT_849856 [Trichophaea hybrida]